jgi:hypothetical protein
MNCKQQEASRMQSHSKNWDGGVLGLFHNSITPSPQYSSFLIPAGKRDKSIICSETSYMSRTIKTKER